MNSGWQIAAETALVEKMFEAFGTAAEIRPNIKGKLLLEALDYWASLSPEGAIPARRAIDPMAIPNLLPTTIIVEAEDDGGFRYQLGGSLVEEKYQLGSIKGKTPQEIMGDAAENVLKPYRRVRDEGVLFYRERTLGHIPIKRFLNRQICDSTGIDTLSRWPGRAGAGIVSR